MTAFKHANRTEPLYVAKPHAWAAKISNDTTAVEVVPASLDTARLESWYVFNHHTEAVEVEFIRNDDVDEFVFHKANIPAGEGISLFPSMYSEPEDWFSIVPAGHSLLFRTPTAVAGDVVAEANGGLF